MKQAIKTFLLCFFIATLVFSLVSFILTDAFFTENGTMKPTDPDTGSEPVSAERAYTGQSFHALLIYAPESDPSGEDIRSLLLLRVDQERGRVFYTPIPTNILFTVSGIKTPLPSLYDSYGPDYLCAKLHALIGLEIDFYTILTDHSIKLMVDAVDGLTYTVPVDVREYDEKGDLRTILSSGTQKLTGVSAIDMLKNENALYLQHAKLSNEANFAQALLAKLLSDSYRPHFAALYVQLTNTVKTNRREDESAQRIRSLEESRTFPVVAQYIIGEDQDVGQVKYFTPNEEETLAEFIRYKKIYNINT